MKGKKRYTHKGTLLRRNEIEKLDRYGNFRYEFRYKDYAEQRRSITSPTLEGLREKEEELNKRLYTGLSLGVSSLTFDKCYARWLSLKSSYLKPTTLSVYDYTYNRFIKDVYGSKRIELIKKSELKLFYSDLYKKGYKVGFLEAINKILQGVFEMLVEDEYLLTNPAQGALKELKKRNPRKTGVKNSLTVEQEDLLINFLNSYHKYSFVKYPILFLFFSGTRFSEMAGLTWNDIEFDDGELNVGWIHINRRLTTYTVRGKGNFISLDTPKTVNSVRDIPLLKNLEELLIEYKQLCEAAEYKCNETVDGVSEFIFFNERTKKAMRTNALNKILKKIVKEANKEQEEKGSKIRLPENLSTHFGRHTYATRANEHNVNVRVTSLLLGHSKTDSSLTLDTYIDVKKSFLISEANKVYN